MQIVLTASGYLLPDRTTKIRAVVAGRISVFALQKVEIISIFSIWVSQCLLKPFMLTGTMIYYKIHDNMHTTFFCLCQQCIKVLHGSKFFPDFIVVRDIISLVYKGRLIDWRKPDDINAQFL